MDSKTYVQFSLSNRPKNHTYRVDFERFRIYRWDRYFKNESEIIRKELVILRYVKAPNPTLYENLKSAPSCGQKRKDRRVSSKNGYVVERGQETAYN
ncbi:hypothetical protein [Bacillus mycoides]|uniref:hypothetical protein n=1 Tax=Bacillus mycoides TaxID=1405 RepID=UPI003D0246AB